MKYIIKSILFFNILLVGSFSADNEGCWETFKQQIKTEHLTLTPVVKADYESYINLLNKGNNAKYWRSGVRPDSKEYREALYITKRIKEKKQQAVDARIESLFEKYEDLRNDGKFSWYKVSLLNDANNNIIGFLLVNGFKGKFKELKESCPKGSIEIALLLDEGHMTEINYCELITGFLKQANASTNNFQNILIDIHPNDKFSDMMLRSLKFNPLQRNVKCNINKQNMKVSTYEAYEGKRDVTPVNRYEFKRSEIKQLIVSK